ncbi:MAG: hypothetical protein V1775_19020 [Bacteroidota bacterium]
MLETSPVHAYRLPESLTAFVEGGLPLGQPDLIASGKDIICIDYLIFYTKKIGNVKN